MGKAGPFKDPLAPLPGDLAKPSEITPLNETFLVQNQTKNTLPPIQGLLALAGAGQRRGIQHRLRLHSVLRHVGQRSAPGPT